MYYNLHYFYPPSQIVVESRHVVYVLGTKIVLSGYKAHIHLLLSHQIEHASHDSQQVVVCLGYHKRQQIVYHKELIIYAAKTSKKLTQLKPRL